MVAAAIVLKAENRWEALPCPNPRILVFSKTQGFRHDSIPEGIAAIKKMGELRHWPIQVTEDSAIFTKEGLSKFDAVVFLNTTGDVLDAKQQSAFESFVESGGGYVGVHAASDCEYDWPWYAKCVGAYFDSHPAIQKATIKVEDHIHPSTSFLPADFSLTDEWYNFKSNPRSNVRVLASLDESSYEGGKMMGDHPIMWCLDVGKGRSWYTNLGHRKETYVQPQFLETLEQGILWASQGNRPAKAMNLHWLKNQWNIKDGLISNGGGGTVDLKSVELFGDQLVHVEFKTPNLTNSGVFVQGRYEVQIFTSAGKPDKELTYNDAGGIFTRYVNSQALDGVAPKRNAMRGPGVWNTLDILFQAPRYFTDGRKQANAKFIEVRLNGIVVQDSVDLKGPTQNALGTQEVMRGPLRLQGDSGAIEFRNVWVLPTTLP